MAATDWENPCQRVAALSAAYYQLIAGGTVASVEYAANGVARKVTYSFSNLASLRREMLAAEDECAILNGTPRRSRRFAIEAGSQRRVWGNRP